MNKAKKAKNQAQVARASKAKEIATRRAAGEKIRKTFDPALGMAYAYESVLGEYSHNPALRYLKGGKLDPANPTTKCFGQAAIIADHLNADYEDYVWAQFYWMHTWFGRECADHELRGRKGQIPAAERYMTYMDLVAKGEISRKVYALPVVESRTPIVNLDRINEKRLDRLMRVWKLTEEEVYLRFAADGVFDHPWLLKRPAYRSLKSQGRL